MGNQDRKALEKQCWHLVSERRDPEHSIYSVLLRHSDYLIKLVQHHSVYPLFPKAGEEMITQSLLTPAWKQETKT